MPPPMEAKKSTQEIMEETKLLLHEKYAEVDREGYLTIRLNQSLFPSSRAPTLRFWSLFEPVHDINDHVVHVKKSQRQSHVYCYIHKGVRHTCMASTLKRAGAKETRKDCWNILWSKRCARARVCGWVLLVSVT